MKDVSKPTMDATVSSHQYSQQNVSILHFKIKINCVATVPVNLQKVCSVQASWYQAVYTRTVLGCESSQRQYVKFQTEAMMRLENDSGYVDYNEISVVILKWRLHLLDQMGM